MVAGQFLRRNLRALGNVTYEVILTYMFARVCSRADRAQRFGLGDSNFWLRRLSGRWKSRGRLKDSRFKWILLMILIVITRLEK